MNKKIREAQIKFLKDKFIMKKNKFINISLVPAGWTESNICIWELKRWYN